MNKGRKLKKAEQKFKNDVKSFEVFCAENGIELSVPEKKKINRGRLCIGISTAVAVTAVAAVCICIPLLRNSSMSDTKVYSDNDVVFEKFSFDELTDTNVVLFDMSKVEEYVMSQIIYSNTEQPILLGYQVLGVVYFDSTDGTESLYEFDYLVRTNKQYSFKDSELYDGLSNSLIYNDVDYKYGIIEGALDKGAFIRFEHGSYDYFIRLYEADYTTEINNYSVETFIRMAF